METQEDYLAYLEIKKLRKLKKFPVVKGIEDKRLHRIYPLMQKRKL